MRRFQRLPLSAALILGICLVGLPHRSNAQIEGKSAQAASLPAKDSTHCEVGTPSKPHAGRQKIDLEFNQTPLKEVARQLSERAGVPVVLARRPLADAALGEDTPVTFRFQGVLLELGLELMLGELKLVAVARDDVIEITTPEDAESHEIARVHNIEDLVDQDRATGDIRGIDPDTLIDMAQSLVEPDSWGESGPGNVMELAYARIVFRQTADIHCQVEQLFNLLRQVRAQHAADKQELRKTVLFMGEPPALEKLAKEQISLQLENRPLQAAIEEIGKQLQVPVFFEQSCLADAGITLDRPVSIGVKDISPKTALRLILADLQLKCIDLGEALLITTAEDYAAHLVIRAYPIYDLLPQQSHLERRFRTLDLDSFVDMVTTAVDSQSWNGSGGPGVIAEIDAPPALIVAQTQEVHDKIADLLAQVRAAGVPLPAAEPPFDPAPPVRRVIVLAPEYVHARRDTPESAPGKGDATTQIVVRDEKKRSAAEVVKLIREIAIVRKWDMTGVSLIPFEDRIIVEARPAAIVRIEDFLAELRLAEPSLPGFGGGGGGFGGGGFF